MSNRAIVVEGLSKKYQIGAAQRKFPTLRDSISHAFSTSFRRKRKDPGSQLWALKDVSFEIRTGEVTAVIGRNGAGKSTLLKILSRITEPTEGFAEIYGRVGSLLEVGTGFHPELTGRENVFLNGAILGMRREEIERKFDEIVSFAEVERFLETPVKHYSTGMFMRLAFSVAAHLEPEILLVDEVLAVGDAEFQKKCLGKMDGVAKEGRTVLFVSHNMPAVQSLCSRCIVLHKGMLQSAGTLQEGIRLYHAGAAENGFDDSRGAVAIRNLRVNGSSPGHARNDRPVDMEFDLGVAVELSGLRLIVVLEDASGTMIFHSVRTERHMPYLREPGRHRLCLRMPPLLVTPGAYSYYVKFIYHGVGEHGANTGGRVVSDKELVTFEGDYSPDSAPGILSPGGEWSAAPLELGADEPVSVSSIH